MTLQRVDFARMLQMPGTISYWTVTVYMSTPSVFFIDIVFAFCETLRKDVIFVSGASVEEIVQLICCVTVSVGG